MGRPFVTQQENSMNAGTFTRQELSDFINSSPKKAISFAVSYAPTAVYRFIKANYGDDFITIGNGGETAGPAMETMDNYLGNKLDALRPAQRIHFLINLFHSLPAKAQFPNWTNPAN